MDWPLVDKHDDGIRPAGRPDECLYCRKRVGQPHGPECVVVTKLIEMQVTATLPSEDRARGAGEAEVLVGIWRLTVPHFWDEAMSNFHKNDSSWCASNVLEERSWIVWQVGGEGAWEKLEPLDDEQRCLCSTLSFRFLRVVDATPRRKIRVPGSDCIWCEAGADCPRHPSEGERPLS